MQQIKNPIAGALEGKTGYRTWSNATRYSADEDITQEDSREDYSEYAVMERLGMSIRDFM